jgi:polyribonucleotide nucleotidyltransferase
MPITSSPVSSACGRITTQQGHSQQALHQYRTMTFLTGECSWIRTEEEEEQGHSERALHQYRSMTTLMGEC